MTKQEQNQRKEHSKKYLLALLQSGDMIFGIPQPTNSTSGRIVQIYFAAGRNKLVDITNPVAVVCGLQLCRYGLLVKGYGHNHTQAVMEELSIALNLKLEYRQESIVHL